MTIKKRFSYCTGFLQKALMVYRDYPNVAIQVVIIACLLTYMVACGISASICMLIFSILSCSMFTRAYLFLIYKRINLLDASSTAIMTKIKNRHKVICFCMMLPFAVVAYYNHDISLNHLCLEVVFWTCFTATTIMLHDALSMFANQCQIKSTIGFFLETLTTPLIGGVSPIGSLLVYFIYIPYVGLYWGAYVAGSSVSDGAATIILWCVYSLKIILLMVYYRLAIYLLKKVYTPFSPS